MTGIFKKFGSRTVLRVAALASAGIAVSGCTYDVGLGYASDDFGYGRGDSYYDCDPYSPFDSYYQCDNGNGFSNIGYSGGWYDNLWYPGYGFFVFDNYGQRYNMRDNHRRYWGEQRRSWYRDNRGGDRDRSRHDGRGRGYSDNATPGMIGRPEGEGRQMRGRNGQGHGDQRDWRNGQWRGGQGQGANTAPPPNREVVNGPDHTGGRRERNDQWRGVDGSGANAIPLPNREMVDQRGADNENGNRRNRFEPGQERPTRRDSGDTNATPIPQADVSMDRADRRNDEFRQPPPSAQNDSQSEYPSASSESSTENAIPTLPRREREKLDRR